MATAKKGDDYVFRIAATQRHGYEHPGGKRSEHYVQDCDLEERFRAPSLARARVKAQQILKRFRAQHRERPGENSWNDAAVIESKELLKVIPA